MINEFLNWLEAHPSYSDNTKSTYGLIAASSKFDHFLKSFLTNGNAVNTELPDKSLETKKTYYKIARLICRLNQLPIPEVIFEKAQRKRNVFDKPPSPLRKLTWGQFMDFTGRVEDGDWRLIFQVAALTGLRAGELYALTPKCITPDWRYLTIQSTYTFVSGTYSAPKNNRVRYVPINSKLKSLLLPRLSEEFLLPHPKEFTQGLQSSALKRFCHKYGIESIKFHTIRSLVATKLWENNVPTATVMTIFGWASMNTAKRYLDLSRVGIQGATDSLGEIRPVSFWKQLLGVFKK